jgi:L-gulonolactone oxidase
MIANYGKNLRFAPKLVAYPANADEIARHVRSARKVRAMGSRHSWSPGIVTDDMLLSLDRMNRVLDVDTTSLRVTVQAGIKLKDLVRHLDARGLALANLGSIIEQSLAGAMATGTHGTGIAFQCLASQVESLKLVDGAGRERELRRGERAFDAVVVGLGCFGVVHEMTLRVVPSFQIHAITDVVPFDDVIENLDAYVRGFDHFKLWWLVPSDRVVVYTHKRTGEPRNDSDLTRWFKDELISVAAYRTLVALGKVNRARFIPTINEWLTSMAGARFERTCKSYVGFLTPDPPVHRETEWAFDYAHAKDLLRKYRVLLTTGGHAYNFIQEVRFTQGDDFWLSPAYGRDSIWLSMYNIDADAPWRAQLARFETFAMANGGRPHWGKEGRLDAAYLAAAYPRREAFRVLMKEHDPGEKFVNAWAETIFA